MGFENISEYGIIAGFSDIITVTIALIIGIKLIFKYFNHKEKSLLTIGLTCMILSISWMAGALSFLLYGFFNIILDKHIFLLLALGFTPSAVILWVYSIFSLIYSMYRKLIVLIYLIFFIIFEIILIFFIFNQIESIGIFYERFYFKPNLLFTIYDAILLITFFITGILFIKQSFQSGDKRIIWKGRFLLLSILSLTIGIAFEGFFFLPALGLIFVRILLVSSTFEYYLGFFLPEKLSNFLIK